MGKWANQEPDGPDQLVQKYVQAFENNNDLSTIELFDLLPFDSARTKRGFTLKPYQIYRMYQRSFI